MSTEPTTTAGKTTEWLKTHYSHCCHSPVSAKRSSEGTGRYICDECNEACDTMGMRWGNCFSACCRAKVAYDKMSNQKPFICLECKENIAVLTSFTFLK